MIVSVVMPLICGFWTPPYTHAHSHAHIYICTYTQVTGLCCGAEFSVASTELGRVFGWGSNQHRVFDTPHKVELCMCMCTYLPGSRTTPT
jgi:hypothetical protein